MLFWGQKAIFKVEWSCKKDQKVSLNMAKKDQLCAISLIKIKYVLKVLLKMLLWQPATATPSLRFYAYIVYSIDANSIAGSYMLKLINGWINSEWIVSLIL